MKKTPLFLLLFLVLLPIAFAFDTLSVSKIDFLSNDAELQGTAFLLYGVENGRSDYAVYQLKDVESSLPAGYSLESKNGEIKSQLTDYRISYPLINDNKPIYKAQLVGSKLYLLQSESNLNNWCSGLAGSADYWIWKKEKGNIYVKCIAFDIIGYTGRLSTSPVTLFTDEITVTNAKGQTEKVSLTNANQIGKATNIIAKFVSMQGSPQSKPQLGVNYGAIYDSSNNQWRIVSKALLDTYTSYIRDSPTPHEIFYGKCESLSVDECIADLNSKSNIPSKSVSEYQNNLVQSKTNGQLILSNTPIYDYPSFTLKIDADWVGIYQPVGKPVFVGKASSECFVEGQNGKITFSLKNDADVDASFNIGITCGGEFDAIQQGAIAFKKGETKTLTYFITAQTTSKSTSSCTITAKDSSNPSSMATSSASVCVTDATQCPQTGEKRCYGQLIQQCTSENGVNVWKQVTICDNQCVYENGVPVCGSGGGGGDDGGQMCVPTLAFGSWVVIPSFEMKEAGFFSKLIFGKTDVSCVSNFGWIAFVLALLVLLIMPFVIDKMMRDYGNKNRAVNFILGFAVSFILYLLVLNFFWWGVIIAVVGFIITKILGR